LWADGRDSPGNEARLCVKGRYGWDYALHEQRLTTPLIRRTEWYPKGALSKEVRGDGRKGSGIVDYAEVMPAFRAATWARRSIWSPGGSVKSELPTGRGRWPGSGRPSAPMKRRISFKS